MSSVIYFIILLLGVEDGNDVQKKATAEFHRALFLQAKSIPGFDEFVTQSRAPGWPAQFASRPSMIAAAKKIITQYSMDELRAARQHFNTAQLIAFWRYFSELIERGVEAHAIKKNLPLFGVSYDPRTKRPAIQGMSGEALFGGFFKESTKPGADFVRLTLTQADARRLVVGREELLISLRGRLAHTFFLAKTSMVAVYDQFLIKERAENSVAWEAYQTHLFLSAFLYKPESPGFSMSIFDHIFFASDLRELGLFLLFFLSLVSHCM